MTMHESDKSDYTNVAHPSSVIPHNVAVGRLTVASFKSVPDATASEDCYRRYLLLIRGAAAG